MRRWLLWTTPMENWLLVALCLTIAVDWLPSDDARFAVRLATLGLFWWGFRNRPERVR